jgi:hypothetical protein
LLQKISKSLKLLLPDNKVSIKYREENCADISVYSNYLKEIIPWKDGKGSKFKQRASVPNWIKSNKKYKINCLRGLIETDGSIYYDRGYKMVIFTTIISDLAKDFYEMVVSLGFNPHLYKIKRQKSLYNLNQQILFHVRLSKNVSAFLNLVKPEKA